MSQLLVITDLDGSLLDHYTYSFAAAVPMLSTLAERKVPVVLCSSKTRAEMQMLRARLGLEHCPYIVENGAAIYLPLSHYPNPPAGADVFDTEWRHAFGRDRLHWQDLLLSLPDELRAGYRKFSKMTVGQIADLTGLSLDDAALAAKREFGEPLQWRGSDELKARLIETLEAKGARVLQGGRFLHVAGDWDKGRALTWLADYLGSLRGAPLTTLALGDSHNDIAMLEAADYAVLIRSPVHNPPELNRNPPAYLSTFTGPRGWAEGVAHVLAELDAA